MKSTALRLANRLLDSRGLVIQGRPQEFPVECNGNDQALLARVKPYTMTSYARLWALLSAVRYVAANNISGDLVECGVWRGGSAALMALAIESRVEPPRTVWMYDTFCGMTAPTDKDVESRSGTPAGDLLAATAPGDGNNVWALASLSDVKGNLRTLGVPESRIRIVEGDVCETLCGELPEKISVLRLDTDFYASTAAELEVLYPRVSLGGVVIVDDYGHWDGARAAVDEYLAKLPDLPLVVPLDETGRLWVKR